MVNTTQAAMLGLVALLIAFAFPAFISGVEDGQITKQVIIESGEGGSEEVDDVMQVTVTNEGASSVTLDVASLQTGDSTNVTVAEGATETVTLDNRSVNITAVNIAGGSSGEVTLRVEYPKDFAWSESAKGLSAAMPIAIAIIPLVIVGMLISVVFK